MFGKHTLNPNEETELKVDFDTEGRPGPFLKKVTFSTNIPGQENIQVFSIRGMVKEAPAAKILVKPRRIILDGSELTTGRKQALSVINQGSLPLVITRIYSKDDGTVYFDGSKNGDLVIESEQTETIDLDLAGRKSEGEGQDYIIIDSNAKNAGKTGYFLIVQYGSRGK